jgi:hypothetical protein
MRPQGLESKKKQMLAAGLLIGVAVFSGCINRIHSVTEAADLHYETPTSTLIAGSDAPNSELGSPFPTSALTKTPAFAPTVTETLFPYELPPLPSLNGITVTQLAECDLSIVIGDWTGYFIVAKDAQEKQYIIPNPRYINTKEYETCNMYSVETGDKGLDTNREALLKAVLNMNFQEGNEISSTEIKIEPFKVGTMLDEFRTTTHLLGQFSEVFPWIMKSNLEGIIFVVKDKTLYFFTTKSYVPEEIQEQLEGSFLGIMPFQVEGEELNIFGLFNKIYDKVLGKVSQTNLEFTPAENSIVDNAQFFFSKEDISYWEEAVK